MNEIKTLGDAVIFSSTSLWGVLVSYLPMLIGAIIVLVVGWIIATLTGTLIEKFGKKIKLDQIMKKLDPRGNLANQGIDFHLSVFLGACFKWFLALVFLMATAEVLGLQQISSFFERYFDLFTQRDYCRSYFGGGNYFWKFYLQNRARQFQSGGCSFCHDGGGHC